MIKNPNAVALGKIGGSKTAERLKKDPNYYRKIGAKGNRAQGKIVHRQKVKAEKPI